VLQHAVWQRGKLSAVIASTILQALGIGHLVTGYALWLCRMIDMGKLETKAEQYEVRSRQGYRQISRANVGLGSTVKPVLNGAVLASSQPAAKLVHSFLPLGAKYRVVHICIPPADRCEALPGCSPGGGGHVRAGVP
jgi:hypothetical protein